MADFGPTIHGYSDASIQGFEITLLPDYDREFITEKDLYSFAGALGAPEVTSSSNLGDRESERTRADVNSLYDKNDERLAPSNRVVETSKNRESLLITAQNDWASVYPAKFGGRGKKKGARKRGKPPQRTSDETREGYVYTLLKWPLLTVVLILMSGLATCYLLTRLYVWLYEYYIIWRGPRENLRKKLQSTTSYADWVRAAEALDRFLGNHRWKEEDKYAYYDHKTVSRVLEQMRRCRQRIDGISLKNTIDDGSQTAVEELQLLISACVKNNFVGIENSRLYSETYYGTKNLVQDFVDEGMSTSISHLN